ncbi:superinfection immunity protein [Pseudoalteromonas tunicata]|jgi:hypothetical protein|uniref:Superinfection immunity protein n=1 Tax=Pseudoalteromonas tunicata D2 TaxID=87626 RepID=A4C5D8_9GAMM|nr:superinfection immunity protein [Pseudoalteromonas tunicata]ATC96757.1 hypothetical protein PTUN_b0355 [Pseudoalteromonas tunicata]AXT32907.1 superinfection immunity protein [Pseudoalteromonas tunicata]EAR30770.1 hypothetical protein PTD2_04336 [Pseudoalteromonas tunicata D2]MDP4983865.1 superinfection immunity protein [Pseudoalteromonas tunicata]MDP5215513.1 superinfection immunity protein [Pseudoalteromonas tunicata]
METIQNYLTVLEQANTLTLILFGVFFLVVWFLPSLLALLFNRQHALKIALLNVPAGLSWIAWIALCVWAVTGKLSDKLAAKARLKPISH